MNHASVIIIDLDGPLLETKWRQHACYAEFLAREGRPVLDLESFWALKRQGTSTRQILQAAGHADIAEKAAAHWTANIEREDLLGLDAVQPGAIATLRVLGSRNDRRVLCTLRQDSAATRRQLESTGLLAHLDGVHIVPHAAGASGKARAVAQELQGAKRKVWIGDTEVDATAARALGCELWLVESGVRGRPALEKLRPDRLVPAFADCL